MQEYICDSLELGPSETKTFNEDWRKYSYIKINGEAIKNVVIKKKLDIILRDQFSLMEDPHNGGPVKLWVEQMSWPLAFRGNQRIAAITQPDGQTFRQSARPEIVDRNGVIGVAVFVFLISLNLSVALGLFLMLIFVPIILILNKRISKIREIPADYEF